jgi:hypothetical protein
VKLVASMVTRRFVVKLCRRAARAQVAATPAYKQLSQSRFK